MEKYVCVCGWEYDPAVGDPDGGIAPGTAFADIPDDWVCPVCGLGKDAFSPAYQNARRPEPKGSGRFAVPPFDSRDGP